MTFPRRLLLAHLLFVAACGDPTPQAGSGIAPELIPWDTTCSPSAWSHPDEATRARLDGPFFRYPSLAVNGERRVLTGTNLSLYDEKRMPEPTLLVHDLITGASLGVPPGEHLFFFPKVLMGRGGVLHLVWGEPEDPGEIPRREEWEGIRQKTLWYASHTEAEGWSTPRELYRTEGRVFWREEMSGFVQGSDGDLHAVFFEVSGTPGSFIHLRLSPEGDQTVNRLELGPGGYVNLSLSPDWIRAAYVAATVEGSGVYFTEFSFSDSVWGKPKRVGFDPGGRPTRSQVLSLGGDTLALVWGLNLSGGVNAEVMRLAISTDGGKDWRIEGNDLELPTRAHSPRAATDACGTILLFIKMPSETWEETSLGLATWNRNWSPIRKLPHTPDAFEFGFHLSRSHELLFIAGKPDGVGETGGGSPARWAYRTLKTSPTNH